MLRGEKVGSLNGHINRVSCLGVSNDGISLCTGSWDSLVGALWRCSIPIDSHPLKLGSVLTVLRSAAQDLGLVEKASPMVGKKKRCSSRASIAWSYHSVQHRSDCFDAGCYSSNLLFFQEKEACKMRIFRASSGCDGTRTFRGANDYRSNRSDGLGDLPYSICGDLTSCLLVLVCR